MSITKINADVMDLGDDYTFTGSVGGAGKIVQVVNVQSTAFTTSTTLSVLDTSVPQNTEGTEFLTLAITPTSATNKLFIEVDCPIGRDASSGWIVYAVFQDSTADALFSKADYGNSSNELNVGGKFNFYMTAGTAIETTFKLRAGPNNAQTIRMNGSGGSDYLGGTQNASITITEIAA